LIELKCLEKEGYAEVRPIEDWGHEDMTAEEEPKKENDYKKSEECHARVEPLFYQIEEIYDEINASIQEGNQDQTKKE
jgi:hypothetical protein